MIFLHKKPSLLSLELYSTCHTCVLFVLHLTWFHNFDTVEIVESSISFKRLSFFNFSKHRHCPNLVISLWRPACQVFQIFYEISKFYWSIPFWFVKIIVYFLWNWLTFFDYSYFALNTQLIAMFEVEVAYALSWKVGWLQFTKPHDVSMFV